MKGSRYIHIVIRSLHRMADRNVEVAEVLKYEYKATPKIIRVWKKKKCS